MVEDLVGRFGRLDGLVNNASTFFATAMGRITGREWDALMGSNFKAPLFLAQAAAPYLKVTRGAVVNVSDIHGSRPLAGFAVYCAAKAGLDGLTKALAIELAPEVRVNAVAPGPVEGPEDGTFDTQTRQDIIDHTLLKRTGCSADIARSVLFLLAGAPYVTGLRFWPSMEAAVRTSDFLPNLNAAPHWILQCAKIDTFATADSN